MVARSPTHTRTHKVTRVKNTDTLRERAARRAPPAKDEIAEKFEREKKANAEYAEFGFVSFPSFQTAEAYVFVRNPLYTKHRS